MASKRKSTEEYSVKKEEVLIMAEIIKARLGVDIFDPNRYRPIINGRMIMYKIFRIMGYTLKEIANVVKKDHSTIINALDRIDGYLEYDEEFTKLYESIRDEFLSLADVDEDMTSRARRDQYALEYQVQILTSKIIQLNLKMKTLKDETKKFLPVIDVIKERELSDSQIKFIARRINQILNNKDSFVE